MLRARGGIKRRGFIDPKTQPPTNFLSGCFFRAEEQIETRKRDPENGIGGQVYYVRVVAFNAVAKRFRSVATIWS